MVNQQTSTQDLVNNADANTIIAGEHEKKTSLTGVHLTESSSSGSITDSICTAYEQNHGDNTHTDTSNNKTSPVNDKLSRNDSVISTMFGGELLNNCQLLFGLQVAIEILTLQAFFFYK